MEDVIRTDIDLICAREKRDIFQGFPAFPAIFFLLLLIKEKVISKSSVFGLKEECSFRKLSYLEKRKKKKRIINPDLR